MSDRLTPAVCTDPTCTIRRRPGFPMHGPHDFRAARPAPEPDRAELLAELEALEAERDCLVLEIDRLRSELDS